MLVGLRFFRIFLVLTALHLGMLPSACAQQTVGPKIKQLILEQLGIEPERITANARLVEDLKADSLDILELITAVEKGFGITIPDEDKPKLDTPGNLTSYVEQILKIKSELPTCAAVAQTPGATCVTLINNLNSHIHLGKLLVSDCSQQQLGGDTDSPIQLPRKCTENWKEGVQLDGPEADALLPAASQTLVFVLHDHTKRPVLNLVNVEFRVPVVFLGEPRALVIKTSWTGSGNVAKIGVFGFENVSKQFDNVNRYIGLIASSSPDSFQELKTWPEIKCRVTRVNFGKPDAFAEYQIELKPIKE